MRDTLAEVLESSGLRVVVSSGDPDAFLQRLAAVQPTVAIVDLMLESADGSPRVHGLGVLREVHQWHPDIHTVVLSASREPRIVEKCLAEGACGFLHKVSADVESVVRAVRSAARGERMAPFDFFDSSSQPAERGSDLNTVDPRNLLATVTSREREVLAYVASGADNLKIATHLQITERTVKAHVSSLYRKLGPENRAQLALLARQLGVRPPTGV